MPPRKVDEPVVLSAPKLEDTAGEDSKAALLDQNRMRDYFAAQKKVAVKVSQDEWVQINGYVFIIKKGERVDVPEDVANLLEEAGRL
jgi:hypothetical protein